MLRIILFLIPFQLYSKEISISFDDAPLSGSAYMTGMERTEKLIASLKKAKVKTAIFYSNPGKVKNAKRLERLKMYQKAGHLIGNHTFDHISAEDLTSKQFLEEVKKADVFLKKHNLLTPYFRYPYLRRGESLEKVRAIKDGLEQMGYLDAYVTIDNSDWYMYSLFRDAVKNKKRINFENLKRFYVETLMKSVDFFDKLAIDELGRSPKHVLLLHENDLAALYIDDLVEHLRSKGWKITTPQESYTDPLLTQYPDVLHHNSGRITSKAIESGYKNDKGTGLSKEVMDKLFNDYKIIQ